MTIQSISVANLSKVIGSICKGGTLDKSKFAEVAKKFGFDPSVLAKCSTVFDAEAALKGLMSKGKGVA